MTNDNDDHEIQLDEEIDAVPPSIKRDNAPKREKLKSFQPLDGRTKLRQSLTPYLPPPVVKAMSDMDPLLEPYVGPEGSITILSTLFLSIVMIQIARIFSNLVLGGRGKALADDPHDHAQRLAKATPDFGETVILCGPSSGGKTRLFYYLCHGESDLPTVMSLRANAALLESTDNDKPVRVLDYPGHASLQDDLFLEMLQSKPPLRFVLVVDSTGPVAPVADVLYDLLQHAKTRDVKWDIFVACHKCDLAQSKNPRRLKIQIRSELEKLVQVRSSEAAAKAEDADADEPVPWWAGETPSLLDLDQLPFATLRLEATTCNTSDGIKTLAHFCRTGK